MLALTEIPHSEERKTKRTRLGEGQEFSFGNVELTVPVRQPAGNETWAGR